MKNGLQNDPRGSKMTPRGAKMEPKGPNLGQKGAKRGPKNVKNRCSKKSLDPNPPRTNLYIRIGPLFWKKSRFFSRFWGSFW